METTTYKLDIIHNWEEKDFGFHGYIFKPAYDRIIGHLLAIFPWIHTFYEWNVIFPIRRKNFLVIQGYLSNYARIDFILASYAPDILVIRLSGKQIGYVGIEETVIIKKLKCNYRQEADLIGGMSMILEKYFSWAAEQDDPLEPNFGDMLFRPYQTVNPIKTADATLGGTTGHNITIAKNCTIWVNPLQTTIGVSQGRILVPGDQPTYAEFIKKYPRHWLHPRHSIKECISSKSLVPVSGKSTIYPPDLEKLE